MSKCKELGEAAVMEKVAETVARGRKRKADLGESELTTSSVELKTRRLDVVTPENSGNSACESVNSDHVSASCCSSNGSSELDKGSSKSVDLEDNEVTNFELIVTSAGKSVESRDRRGTTPSSEVNVQSGDLESTSRPPRELNSRRSTAAKTPSEAELEEFFSVAEKNLQKEFIDKYNYDIVKDEPLLEGRYEWVSVQLTP